MEKLEIGSDPLILGGFSQGSMCALHYFSKNFSKYNFQKLALLSSHLVARSLLFTNEELPRVPVFQSHGTNDQVLPYTAAGELLNFLEKNQFQVQFESFMGGHEIPPIVLQKLREFL